MSLDSATEYALSFSADAVHLRRRERSATGQGDAALPVWQDLGSVAFDAPDFRGDFTRLRQMAGAGDQNDETLLDVTLIIPDDQILYTTLTVSPGADRELAVARALEGLTPYAVEDLSFDWEGDGDSVHVAAVARQTLREARDFAAQYGFAGRDYRAAPQSDTYAAEPVFLLEPSRPVRPVVDPAQVSVIAPDLLIESDEAVLVDGDAGQGSLDLDLGGDTREAADMPQKEEAAPEEQAAKASPSASPEVPTKSEPEAPKGESEDVVSEKPDEPEIKADLVADAADERGDQDAEAKAETSAEPAAEDVAEAQPETEPDIASMPEDAASEDAGPEADAMPEPDVSEPDKPEPDQPIAVPKEAPKEAARETEAASAPAVSDVPKADDEVPPAPVAAVVAVPVAAAKDAPRISPVVRHARGDGGRQPAPEVTRPGLNPRARAVQTRAAEARNARSAGTAPAAAGHPRERGGLIGLIVMLGALVVGLILIWAFIVPEPRVAQSAPEDAVPLRNSAAPEVAPEGVAETAQSDAEDTGTDIAGTEAVPTETAPADPAAGTVTAATDSGDEAAAPVTGQSVVSVALPASALTVEEQRYVVVAASAVAAGVVAPRTARAEPEPPSAEQVSVPETAQDEAAQVSGQPEIAATQPLAAVISASDARPARSPQQEAVERALRAAVETTATTPAAAAGTGAASAPETTGLTRSARPQLAPRRTTPQTSEPRADAAPSVPANPLPFEAVQRRVQPAASARPPERARRPAPAAAPVVSAPVASAAPAPAVAAQTRTPAGSSNAALRGSARPPMRPEGSAPELIEDQGTVLEPAELRHLRELIRDLDRAGGADVARGPALPAYGAMLAQARPVRKPGGAASASDAASPSAIDAAVRSATTTSPPGKPRNAAELAAPARDSGGLLRGSVRPQARPGSQARAVAGLSDTAVEAAISAAVESLPATPGGVRLSALSSSALPPRRSSAAAAADRSETKPAAETSGPGAAELAARRKLDEQLQAQAEARVRARAAADAKAEREERAAAEARARAQAEAEERAARAKRQDYKPPEIDNEPEVAASALSKGTTSASVSKAATEKRAMDMGRTTVIGIIGAGKASRALIRLRNGKIVTVRLGDRIDGGRINSIGNGRLTYVKGGRTHELHLLDGR